MQQTTKVLATLCCSLMIVSLTGCALFQNDVDTPRTTKRDKTKKGAMIGAAGGAVAGAVAGDGELDKVLAGAAIGAGIGAGIGAYMDRQEERLAQIPGTRVERVDEKTLLVHFESDILFSVNSAGWPDVGESAHWDRIRAENRCVGKPVPSLRAV